jgi:hypothetical protein
LRLEKSQNLECTPPAQTKNLQPNSPNSAQNLIVQMRFRSEAEKTISKEIDIKRRREVNLSSSCHRYFTEKFSVASEKRFPVAVTASSAGQVVFSAESGNRTIPKHWQRCQLVSRTSTGRRRSRYRLIVQDWMQGTARE